MIKIPSFLYGKYSEVKRETNKVITKLKKKSLNEIIASDDFIEVGTVPGKIVLAGPNPNLGGQNNFNLFALPGLLTDHLYSGAINKQKIFNDLMKAFWSHMTASCKQDVYSFYDNEQNRVTYLKNLLLYKENYIMINSYFEGLPMIGGCDLNGKLRTNITSIFDHPFFVGKYIVGNLDYVKRKVPDEKINILLYETKLFELFKKFDIEEYIQKFKTN